MPSLHRADTLSAMRRQPLSRPRILAAAIAMADRDGLDEVTLRRLATELGVHVTSFYNHVATRDAVVEGMVETLIEEAAFPTEPLPWESWIRRIAASMRTVAVNHPGASAAFFRQPGKGLAAAATIECGLAAFEQAGLPPREAYEATRATFLTVLGLTADELARHGRGGTVDEGDYTEMAAEQFPRIRQLGEMVNTIDRWSFLVDALVAGIGVRIAERTRST